MRISPPSILRPVILSLAAIAVVGFGHSVAKADEVLITGSTAGCFGAACAPGAIGTVLGLTYNSSTFNGTTAAGFLGLNTTASPERG